MNWQSDQRYIQAKADMEELILEDKTVLYSLVGRPQNEEWTNSAGLQKIEETDLKPGVHISHVAKTRKGSESITLVILFSSGDKHYLDEECRQEIDLKKEPSIAETKQLYMNAVSLSRKGVVWHFKNVEVPKGWRKNSLLRNCKPLILTDGIYECGKTIIQYNKELGVEYVKSE